jgi:hypothetical protein
MGQVKTRFGPFLYRENLFWTHPIVLLGVVDQAEAHFDRIRDNFKIGAWFALNIS